MYYSELDLIPWDKPPTLVMAYNSSMLLDSICQRFFFIGLHVRIHTGVWFLLFKNNLSSSFFFHLSCWGRREHICFIPLAADRQPAVFLVWDTLEMEPRASHMLSTCCIVKLYSPHPLPNEHLKASLWLPFHKRRYPVKQALKK